MTYVPQPLLSTQASPPCTAHDTSTGTGRGKPLCLLPAALGSSVFVQELHLQLVAFSNSPSQPSPYASFLSFSISQPVALGTLHLSPVPSLLHRYSRWPENGTPIKTNRLDQVLHLSLSEQSGRTKEDKDECKHCP